jgi:hypothetical protein
MRYKYFILALLLLFVWWNSASVQAQTDSSTLHTQTATANASGEQTAIKLPKMVFKYSVLSLIEPIPYAQIAFEHRIKPFMHFNYEIGIPIGTATVLYQSHHNISGFRARADMWCFFQRKADKPTDFIGVDLFYKQEKWIEEKWHEHKSGLYQQKLNTHFKNIVYGINFIGGKKMTFDNSPINLDVFVGLGIKVRHSTHSNPPNNYILADNNDCILCNDKSGVFPNLVYGIKIGYALY